jgi:vitamin B12 transporter
MKVCRKSFRRIVLAYALASGTGVALYGQTKNGDLYASRGASTSLVSSRLAATSDTLPNYRIGEVIITGENKTSADLSSTPLQILDRDKLQSTGSLQVSDAVKFFSGVTVKDYGGMGGMKTISVRSMGAQHTAVAYDGIAITDCQTGQIDIGRYSLENVDVISLNIGDGNSIFQPARMFASSGLLTIRTRKPVFEGTKRFHGKIGFKSGSYGFLNPSALGEVKLNSTLDLSISAEYLTSKGNYPYKLFYADGPKDYTTETRTNNDVETYRLESTLFGHFAQNGELEVKAYYYQSDRGLPGAVILYNPYSSQHLWDKNAFAQAHYEQNLTSKIRYQLNGKYNWSWQRYLNPDYLGSTGQEDYSYWQEEAYLSSAFLYKMFSNFSVGLSTDGAVNRMQSNLQDFSEPTRYSLLANLSAKYVQERWLATAGVLATGISETTKSGDAGESLARLSPSFNLSVQPFSNIEDLRVRMFCKSAFRMPSFNDLYYSAIGSSSLKPENSVQLNLGLTYDLSFWEKGPRLNITADAYHNRITDKIMAIPTKNIFIWSMVNLGKVDIKGLDLNLEATQQLHKNVQLLAAWSHSYQRALDVTDPTSKVYNQQIAYAPRIYGSGRMSLVLPCVRFSYALIYSGHRYVTGQNLAENNLDGYTDQSCSIEYEWKKIYGKMLFRAEVMNLGNQNYEVVRNFPMPGRTYRFSVKMEF